MFSNIGTTNFRNICAEKNVNNVSNPFKSDYENIFNAANYDINSYKNIKNDDSDDYFLTPRERFELIKLKQGFIGQCVNDIKNKFIWLSLLGMKGSNEIEASLNRYENSEISEIEISEIILNYKKNQTFLKNIIVNMLTILSICLIFLLFRLSGNNVLALSIGLITGSLIKIVLEKADALCILIKSKYAYNTLSKSFS